MTPVFIGKKAFFWRVVSPKNRGQTGCRIVHIYIYTCKILSPLFWADLILINKKGGIKNFGPSLKFQPAVQFHKLVMFIIKPMISENEDLWTKRKKFQNNWVNKTKEIQTSQLITKVLPKNNSPAVTSQTSTVPNAAILSFKRLAFDLQHGYLYLARASAQRTETNELKSRTITKLSLEYWESFHNVSSLFAVPFGPHFFGPFCFFLSFP